MHWASSIYDSRYQLHPLLFTYAMERLELLEPEIVSGTQRNVQAYALAYIEHYAEMCLNWNASAISYLRL